MKKLLSMSSVSKDYFLGSVTVRALHDISLEIFESEFLTIAGPSGSGKSTLLNIFGCIDKISTGSLTILGEDVEKLDDKQITNFRLNTLGFIFQSFNLLSVLSIYDNIVFPLHLQNRLTTKEKRARVEEMAALLLIEDQLNKKPSELSGGQRQRVAIARALVTHPKIVLADEPTANLDSETGDRILKMMKEIHKKMGTTFIFSSHDPKIIEQANRLIKLKDGRIIFDEMINRQSVEGGGACV